MWDTSKTSDPLIEINVHLYHWLLIFLTAWCLTMLRGKEFVSDLFRCPHVTPFAFH